MLIPSWTLCKEDGPSDEFELVTAHVTGVCLGGPLGGFCGSAAGGPDAELTTEVVIKAFTSQQSQTEEPYCIEKRPFGINKNYLHTFRRRPAIMERYDHMCFQIKEVDGNNYMFWMYVGLEIPVFAKLDDPYHLYVYHRCGSYQCESSWQLTPEGNLKEHNITMNQNWDWIREDHAGCPESS